MFGPYSDYESRALLFTGLWEYEFNRGARVNPYMVAGAGVTQYWDLLPDPERYFDASSAESVGEFRLGQVAKCMIQSEVQCLAGAETEGLSGSHSGLAVEALDDAARELALAARGRSLFAELACSGSLAMSD